MLSSPPLRSWLGGRPNEAARRRPQFDPADFEAFLLVIDANANGELCWAPFWENSAKFGEPFFVTNFMDDVSNVPH
ncbi:MAG TPA: hypothetical protein VHG52_07540 [Thermomicrobiales bacterium]|nr:hypothetical protein [Thermomicrobiales bacterium]